MGVPTLACHCAVCHSKDPLDKRTRPSLLLSYAGRNVVIDTTPDFRFQAMRSGIDRLDAILYTHGHADHILGLDDIRPYNLKHKMRVPIYATNSTLRILQRTFAYIFDSAPTESSVPGVDLHTIDGSFELFGLKFIPVPAMHGPMDVMGFRFGNAAYLTDFSAVPESYAHAGETPSPESLPLQVDTWLVEPLKAPDFSLPDQNGATVRLSDFRGKKNVVLAFYIKAFTSG